MRSLFAEVWDRDVLDLRSRRLLLLGVIAASGQADVWRIQARAALRRRELTPGELRETLIVLAPYPGFPSVSASSRCASKSSRPGRPTASPAPTPPDPVGRGNRRARV